MTELFRRTLPRAVLGLAIALAGAQTARAQEDPGQVINRLKAEMATCGERLDLMLGIGNAAVGVGEFDLALANFQRVLESLEPDSREAGDLYLRIGETYRRKGNAEAAIASLTRASELLSDQPVVMGTLALVLDGSGKKEEAERAYRATLQLDPDNAVALNNLAFLLAEQGRDLDQALGFARHAAQVMPEDVDIIDTLGWVQLKRKQTDSAIGLFAEALGKMPGNEGYRQHLRQALAGKVDRNVALEELKSLLESDFSSADVLRKVTDLLKSVEQPASR